MTEREREEIIGRLCRALEIIEGCREFAALIPEVRTNLVYAAAEAAGPGDVAGIEGRITAAGGMPRGSGRPRFGASSHMARLIIEVRKRDPDLRAGINFASTPRLAAWLEEYCRQKRWPFGVIDRSIEPADARDAEGGSMPWKVSEAIRAAGGTVPLIFYETGAVGKEPVSVLVGRDPVEVAGEACRIARSWAAAAGLTAKVGKVDDETFRSVLLHRLGKPSEAILVAPAPGMDAAVIDAGGGKVLIVAEDPIFSIPGQPLDMFGWYAVHIGASDVAVFGVRPRFMTYSLLLPPGTPDGDLRTIVDSIHAAALELDLSIVGGHTGFYPGFASPTIGGITVFSLADRDAFITPAGARAGDHVILTKGPAVETVGILSVLRESELRGKYPPSVIEMAKSRCRQMTVVKDALTAMGAGGVTAMHDATEGGVMGGLFEIAQASGLGMEIDETRFIYAEDIAMIRDAFGIDPVMAIAEGSLLLTAGPDRSGNVIGKLGEAGIPASVIGTVTADPARRVLKRLDGSVVPLKIPSQDPFWPAFFEALT